MDPALGVIGGLAGMLLVLACVAAWAAWRAREITRLRGYVLVPPPGKHSAAHMRVWPVPAARHTVPSTVCAAPAPSPAAPSFSASPASREATAAVLQSMQELEQARRAARACATSVPVKNLTAPVELWFGTRCVGVVRGSETHLRFDEFASELLAELADPEPSQQRRTHSRRWRRAFASTGWPNSYARDA